MISGQETQYIRFLRPEEYLFLLFFAAETVLWHTSAAEIMKGMEEEGKLLTPTGDTNLADLSN